ncbi:MAG: hypothetical protein KatS3mg020_0571 [Fimbriimonadales bacterium]|nr:MAG: hypothetical protein KatS3mg020_0571 [Fimbriimonadales bacterium]
MKTHPDPNEILRVLDTYINRSYLGDVPNFNSEASLYAVCFGRLTVLRGYDEWVIAIETIDVSKGPFFFHCLYLYGNCLSEQGLVEPCDELFSPDQFMDKTGVWKVNRYHFTIEWQDRLFTFEPTAEEYRNLGIIFPSHRASTDDLEPWELMWYVSEKLRDLFFYTDSELIDMIKKKASRLKNVKRLKKLLQVTQWEHPDVYAGEVPSDTQSFRLIAKMIATGDASLWSQVDPSRFNSHWRYWIEKERTKSQ